MWSDGFKIENRILFNKDLVCGNNINQDIYSL